MAIDPNKGMRPNLYELMQGGGGGGYVLPIASADTLGGVKIGEGVSIDAEGTISVEGATPYELPAATADVLGGVKIGEGVDVDANGTISVDVPAPVDAYTKAEIDAMFEAANLAIRTERKVEDNIEIAAGQRRLATIQFTEVTQAHPELGLLGVMWVKITNATDDGTMYSNCVMQDFEAYFGSNKIQIPVVNTGSNAAKVKVEVVGIFVKRSLVVYNS